MAEVLFAGDPQSHAALRTLFLAAGQAAHCCASAGETRRALCRGGFELLVINAPLSDEFGRDLALQAAEGGLDVLLLCPAPQADKLAAGLERHGVFVPVSYTHLRAHET